MAFTVGQRVVCVDVRPIQERRETQASQFLNEGAIYEIRWIGEFPYSPDRQFGPAVRLVGLFRPEQKNSQYNDYPFMLSRFRPLVSRKTEISFTTGADPKSESWDNRVKVPSPFDYVEEEMK